MFKMIRNFLESRSRQKKTVDELSRLSDRELNDIGISRYEIPGLARQVSNW